MIRYDVLADYFKMNNYGFIAYMAYLYFLENVCVSNVFLNVCLDENLLFSKTCSLLNYMHIMSLSLIIVS